MNRVLLVDDVPLVHVLFADLAEEMGFEFFGVETLEEGLAAARTICFDIVFLDVLLPDGNGLDGVAGMRGCPGGPEVVVITGFGDLAGAREALQSGGWKYLQKPLGFETTRQAVLEVLRYRAQAGPLPDISTMRREGILGESRELNRCLRLVVEAAPRSVNVLLTGETGTGKELFARAVHDNSGRCAGPFVVLDCASLTPNLIASHLFGHVRGAFTGADRSREGVIAQADGGTLFLDEVGELPAEIQAAFLRTLETGRFRPVGGKGESISDFRLVAATNRDLDGLVEQGVFRADLLFRLRTVGIRLPALRDRTGDIALLCESFNEQICGRFGIPVKRFSEDFMEAVRQYRWPGNVRELLHALELAVSASGRAHEVSYRHLPLHIRTAIAVEGVAARVTSPEMIWSDPVPEPAPTRDRDSLESLLARAPFPTLKEFRETLDRLYVERLMTESGGVMTRAAGMAGVSRGYLYELVKKFGK